MRATDVVASAVVENTLAEASANDPTTARRLISFTVSSPTSERLAPKIPNRTRPSRAVIAGQLHLSPIYHPHVHPCAGNEARLNPQHWIAFNNRGRANNDLGEYARAIPDFDAAMHLRMHPGLYWGRGQSYEGLGDYTHAIADFDQAAQMNPNSANFKTAGCRARAAANRDLDLARSLCEESLSIRPSDAPTLAARGLVSLRQSRWQEAWTDHDAALRLDPSLTRARFGRGIAALRQARSSEGQADIAAAAAASQEFANIGITP